MRAMQFRLSLAMRKIMYKDLTNLSFSLIHQVLAMCALFFVFASFVADFVFVLYGLKFVARRINGVDELMMLSAHSLLLHLNSGMCARGATARRAKSR